MTLTLAVLSRLFDRRDALVVVRPETLIRRMASETPLWGEERIANELLLKLGLRVSPRTVGKYLPKRPPGRPRGDQRWSTFLRNHADAIVACDFFMAVTEVMPSATAPTRHRLGEHISVRARSVLGWNVRDIVATVQSMRARGVVFTVYEGLGQDELGIWTAPDGQAKVAWFADPDDGNVLSVSQA